MRNNKKAFTLVEMLVALAVSSIIIAATYASFELIQKQYKKSIDVAEMHTSGRSIMQILEREIRMAGYEFRDATGAMTYGGIVGGLAITDSGDACCDEITIIYDEVEDVVNDLGEVTSSSVERIQTRFWTEAHTSNSGDRFRLYKLKTILGRNNAILGSPIVGAREVMADFIEDLQLINTELLFSILYALDAPNDNLWYYDTVTRKLINSASMGGVSVNEQAVARMGPDGMVYYQGVKNGDWGVLVFNPKTETTAWFNSPNDNYAPGLAFVGNDLYISRTGDLVDVHDVETKQFKRTIDKTSNIKLILDKKLATNENGVTCKAREGSDGISCENPSFVLQTPKATRYGSITFGSGNILYASGYGRNDHIDVFDIATKSYKHSINVSSSHRSHALVSNSLIKSLSSVTISLTLRAKNEYGSTPRGFQKRDYNSGNFNYNFNDRFRRDTFSTSVSVRNM